MEFPDLPFRSLLSGGVLSFLISCTSVETIPDPFADYPIYSGNDLGMSYSPESTSFRMWSPTATAVRLKLYENGEDGDPLAVHEMASENDGTWILRLEGDLEGSFYTFQIQNEDRWLSETPGPYAKAVGVNGNRGYILDLSKTDPEDWDQDQRPPLNSYNDIVIYELHVRDLTIHPSSGSKHPGKFLGFTETGTRSPQGHTTGIDHLKELGVTHVHILPMFDFRSIDESKLEENKFNWGYEPQNYNAPEGSYSTDPYNPEVRIRELKEMIMALHANGIRVIMDVVYNHTGFGDADDFTLSLSVPDYYYRQNEDGTLSDASACGNETASERPMMRKFILESVAYWVNEYHIDGFRFDLMGIHDIVTMNQVSQQLREIDPTLFVYGEGWKAGSSPLPDEQLALKKNVPELEAVAAFSDEIRDGIKGAWNDWESPGFVSGASHLREGVKFGIAGGVRHPQIDYSEIKESKAPWAPSADQCIVYVSCHDNHTLYDKLKIVNPDSPEGDILKMHVLANTIVLTSQGIPFLHAGVDFVRTKQGVENSFDSPDSINQIDWSRKHAYLQIFEFYKQLIALRKAHPLFRLNDQEEIARRIQFMDTDYDNVIAYELDATGTGDSWNAMIAIFNGSDESVDIPVPEGSWIVVAEGTNVDETGIRTHSTGPITLRSYSAILLAKKS